MAEGCVRLGYVRCVDETDLAIKLDLLDTYFWVPKSMIHGDSEVWEANQSGELKVVTWWA